MQYLVHIVGDHELPAGQERVIVEQTDGPPVLLLSGEAARCWAWMRAWEDTVEASCYPTVAIPVGEPLRMVG